ncbi:hypothetical protein EVAR_18250_1 [Eumeta japonica]|uniref:DUF4371 domain-containing protein n=1 Tax=Eumeta variegata TaxID=151549 RepID=A0A4C1UJH5_EUMVA|nr:hypothetical protein EVAR_18250_1 [Eumeta japonica]
MLKWIHLENGLKGCSTIDSLAQSQIEQERQRWRGILERLLAIVNFLASHNLAFRGHREKLTSDSGSSETSAVEKTTAESLTNYIITELEQLGISLQNCRGQRYDNGANMRGEKSGVQKRIIEINPLAYFLPCGSHSWNLILGDAASSCVQAKSFFGLLQRWECRVSSVKAVKFQLSDIRDALKDLAENTTDCQLNKGPRKDLPPEASQWVKPPLIPDFSPGSIICLDPDHGPALKYYVIIMIGIYMYFSMDKMFVLSSVLELPDRLLTSKLTKEPPQYSDLRRLVHHQRYVMKRFTVLGRKHVSRTFNRHRHHTDDDGKQQPSSRNGSTWYAQGPRYKMTGNVKLNSHISRNQQNL